MNTMCSKSQYLQQTLVVIDSHVDDYQMLARGVIHGAEVCILDAHRDGINQIIECLSKSKIQSLHLISHGSPGTLYLGNGELSLSTIEYYAEQLKVAFSTISDLHLYGCNVAAGDAGEEFLSRLTTLTGATLSASTHPIGNGSWQLNTSYPNPKSKSVRLASTMSSVEPIAYNENQNPSLPISSSTLALYPHTLATFTVTNTNDEGAGSLRQAILDANTNAGADNITFGGATFTDQTPDTITLRSALPNLAEDVTINGTGANNLTIDGVDDSLYIFTVDLLTSVF